MTSPESKQTTIDLIEQAHQSGARYKLACIAAGISARTQQRWKQQNTLTDKRTTTPKTPHNKLSEIERQQIIQIANSPYFTDLSPAKIVPTLADKGRYIASE